ncbi:glycosyltransferase [Hymenobacter sp. NST-14]|uniref:glycosyltransferase n=1 Tax=Hymenobacter piscis TaxID=2839984 RepID=UPI001C016A4A|nr:glycosyltransferase [Hymenobacter piscis]MBT9393284.1 glycosyltransferase [Hymenobacter piscis]
MRVLHLPKWYPNRYDDQDGDFVARHVAAIAGAATPEQPLHSAVVFAAVARGPLGKLLEEEADFSGPVPVWRYYYRARPTGLAPLDKVLKLGLYFWGQRRGYRRVCQYWGHRPGLVHVHVLLRTGLWALWLRLRYRIPYLVTEHWTRYLPARAGSIGRVRRWMSRLVVRRASALHTVSENLREAMSALGLVHPHSVVIANVVDTDLFRLPPAPREPHRLLVVSAFHETVKNISGILRVVSQLRRAGRSVTLRLAGYGPDEELIRQRSAELGLVADGTVCFMGKLPHSAVAREMQQATALVSFSRAETFGCVLLEARATGCPVVGPATGGVPELFQPTNTFGILVQPDDESALYLALDKVLTESFQYRPDQLRQDAEQRCGYQPVGRQFARLYQALLLLPSPVTGS